MLVGSAYAFEATNVRIPTPEVHIPTTPQIRTPAIHTPNVSTRIKGAGSPDSTSIDAVPKRSLKDVPQNDLKTTMDGVKGINKRKDSLRSIQDPVNKLNANQAGQSKTLDPTKKGP